MVTRGFNGHRIRDRAVAVHVCLVTAAVNSSASEDKSAVGLARVDGGYSQAVDGGFSQTVDRSYSQAVDSGYSQAVDGG